MLLRTLIQHNLGLKLFALVLACLTWFTLRYLAREAVWAQSGGGPANAVEFTGVRISTLTGVDDTYRYRLQPAEVSIRVNGKPSDLKRLAAQDLQVFVNLNGIKEARDLVREIKALGPPGIVIERIRPPLAVVNTVLTNPVPVVHDPR